MSVWVYKYRYWDADRQEQVVSHDLFTMDAIRSGLGTVVLESAMKVSEEHIDTTGRLRLARRSATDKA